MRVLVRSDKKQLRLAFHRSCPEMRGRGFASNMIWEGRIILLDTSPGDQVRVFEHLDNKPKREEWPFNLKCNHGGLLPAWGDVECEAKFSDGLMEMELPPLHERPWPMFKDDGMLEEHAFNCAVARARSLWRSGCRPEDARSALRLTTNAFNAIPYEAWQEVRQIFNQPVMEKKT